MLDLIKFKSDVSDWIYDFVSRYNTELEAIPCPFAKQALNNNRIVWKLAYNRIDVYNICYDYSYDNIWNNKEVVIIGLDPKNITAEDLSDHIKRLNKEILMPKGYIALDDHPDDEEIINNVKMNQGKWAMVLIQSTSKLIQASVSLEKQGYYSKWSQKNLEDVVSWRN